MLPKTIQNFLNKNKIKYEAINHRTVYTALDKAATLRIKPARVGKTVVLVFDGKEHALALVPANKNLDKDKILAIANKIRQKAGLRNFKKADFAKEQWVKANIKGIKIGTTPPFGPLYDLSLFLDNSLIKQPKIIVNGGNYILSLKITPASLAKLENTIKGNFSQAEKGHFVSSRACLPAKALATEGRGIQI